MGVPGFTPRGAVPTRGVSVFVLGLFELYCYGTSSGPAMGLYVPAYGGISTFVSKRYLTARWLHEPQPIGKQPINGVEIFTPCGVVSTRGVRVLVVGLLKLYVYRRSSGPARGRYRPRVRRDLEAAPK